MNQQSHGEATLSRLLATDWPDGLYTFEHGISRGRLMQEYLRRAAWWALELDATSKWPFFDIAGLWAPDVHSPPELAAQLEALIDEPHQMVRRCARMPGRTALGRRTRCSDTSAISTRGSL